jgi:hypothetical protein
LGQQRISWFSNSSKNDKLKGRLEKLEFAGLPNNNKTSDGLGNSEEKLKSL